MDRTGNTHACKAHHPGRWPHPLMGAVNEAGGRYLRVVVLPDGETAHNAYFDRDFVP
jgi:hypothetical protein